jgi:hypothetical protein
MHYVTTITDYNNDSGVRLGTAVSIGPILPAHDDKDDGVHVCIWNIAGMMISKRKLRYCSLNMSDTTLFTTSPSTLPWN